jgi:hypothetical protein
MENNYSTAKLCPYEQQSLEYADEEPVDKLHCNLALEPGRSSASIDSCQLHIIAFFMHIIHVSIKLLLNYLIELTRILAKSRDYDELLHVWKSWRDRTGKPMRSKYMRFVELTNEAARLNGNIKLVFTLLLHIIK